jgi:hypothetical protein
MRPTHPRARRSNCRAKSRSVGKSAGWRSQLSQASGNTTQQFGNIYMVELRTVNFLEESCTLALTKIYRPVAIYDTSTKGPDNSTATKATWCRGVLQDSAPTICRDPARKVAARRGRSRLIRPCGMN